MAIPPPMVPAPITPTFWMERSATSAPIPGTLLASRWAKKKCCWARDWGPTNSSINRLVSVFSPSSKGWLTAASIQRILYSGARKPLAFLPAMARAISKIAGFSRAPCSFSSRLRTLGCSPPCSAFCRANARASLRRPPSTIWSTNPNAWASPALIGLPVVTISSAFSTPITRGKRWVPPAPGNSPRLTSGNPHWAEATASR